MKRTDDDRYSRHGYKDRADYLDTIADDRGLDPFLVGMMADILGDSEDFDGLISEIEDLEYSGLLNDFRFNPEDGSDE